MFVLETKIQNYRRGQALVELTLIFPMLLTLALGAVEVGNIIYTYQVMHRLTAQGANMASRSTVSSNVPSPSCAALGPLAPYCDITKTVIDAACPMISQGSPPPATCPSQNADKWRVIFTEIGPDPSVPVDPPYVVLKQIVTGAGQITGSKRICDGCGLSNYTCDSGGCLTPTLPSIDTISKGNHLFAFEVFYDYSPITVLGNFVGTNFTGIFYERSVF